MAAKKDQPASLPAEFISHSLRERASLWRWEEKAELISRSGLLILPTQAFNSPEERLGLHDHAGPTSIRHVVRDQMAALRELAHIANPHLEQTLLLRPFEHTVAQRRQDHIGKQRQDVTAHGCGHWSPRMRRSAAPP